MDSCFEEKRVRQDGTGCRMVFEAAEAAESVCSSQWLSRWLIWHLALGTDKEFSKTAFFAVLPTEEIPFR